MGLEKSVLRYTKKKQSKYIQDIPKYTKYQAEAGPLRPAWRRSQAGPALLGILQTST